MSENDSSGLGRDDPNRGPLDRAANAISGGTGGIDAALHLNDPNRGSLNRTADEAGTAGGISAGSTAGSAQPYSSGNGSVVSAVFDTEAEAQRAVADLRSAGVNDSELSVIARSNRTMTTRSGDGEVTDEDHSSIIRGILGGGALGAGLGVLALAIPGVGPLAAAGAIAASAVPEGVIVGSLLGAAAGTFNETLKDHGVSSEDATYYGERLKGGGVLVTVNATAGADSERLREILYRHGGHNAARARTAVA